MPWLNRRLKSRSRGERRRLRLSDRGKCLNRRRKNGKRCSEWRRRSSRSRWRQHRCSLKGRRSGRVIEVEDDLVLILHRSPRCKILAVVIVIQSEMALIML